MSVAYEDGGQVNYVTGVATRSVSITTPAANELIFVMTSAHRADRGPATSVQDQNGDNFTKIQSTSTATSVDADGTFWYKVSDGDETSLEVVYPGTARHSVAWSIYSGTASASPLEDSAEDESKQSTSATSIGTGTATPTTANGVAVYTFSCPEGRQWDVGFASTSGTIREQPQAANLYADTAIADEVYTSATGKSSTFSTTDPGDVCYAGVAVFKAAAGGSPYTLTADAGSYSYTGTDTTLRVGRKVSAASGAYTYTGTTATLAVGRVLTAEAGSYAYTGSDATLTYTPTAAALTAEPGSYTYTGQDVTFKRGLVLSAGGGTYSYTGQDASLTYTPVGAFILTAESGVYTYTGQDAGSLRTYVLPASGGSYAYTGTAAGLAQGYKIAIAAGAYTYTGTAATFGRTYALAAGPGSYAYTGQDVTLTYSNPLIWTEIPSVSTTWTEI